MSATRVEQFNNRAFNAAYEVLSGRFNGDIGPAAELIVRRLQELGDDAGQHAFTAATGYSYTRRDIAKMAIGGHGGPRAATQLPLVEQAVAAAAGVLAEGDRV